MKPALIGLLPLFETTDHLLIWYSMEFYGNQWEKDPFPIFFFVFRINNLGSIYRLIRQCRI